MIPWFQVYSNLPTHPKTAKLADELGLTSTATSPSIVATGILVSLWAWAVQNAYDGDLSGVSANAIADACRWKKNPQKLVGALKSAGYLDEDMRLHDWDEYAMLLIDSADNKKANDRERARRYREKKRHVTEDEVSRYTTVTNRDASQDRHVTERDASVTHHAPTLHNTTLPYSSLSGKKEKKESAEPQDELAEILRGAGIDPTTYT